MSVHNGRLLTDSVIDVLTLAGLTVGDGEKPDGAGWQGTAGQSDFHGYTVVHPITGGTTDGSLANSDEDAWPTYQLSSFGATRAQSEFIADEAREAMLGTPITLDARTVAQVRIDMLGGSRRDDEVQPPIWMAVDRYRILTTP